MSSPSSGSGSAGSDTSTQTAFAVIAGVAALLVALVVFVFYFIRDRGMTKEIVDMARRFDDFKVELAQEQQKKLFKFSKGAKEFFVQYRKPMLQSAFDLQSRLTNQVKNNFLYSFLQERGGERDKNYAVYNFSFVFAEFIGWLEVIRQELVFVTGDDDAAMLASLIEGIKFQLTGETPMQGTAPRGKEDDPEFEVHSKIFQLYAGELRSIGSVMIHADADGNKSIINADEFQRLMTIPPPSVEASSEQARMDWARSRERLFQDMMLPLFDHLRTMAQLPKGQAPIRRLALIQVLLAKLIDLVDSAVPWSAGPKFDAKEEPQYIIRDFRLTPLVAYLNSHQRTWLSGQPFMESADRAVADPSWEDAIRDKDPVWRKLCFCGFREDMAALAQEDREKKPDMWPGACPPRLPRMRPLDYNERRRPGLNQRRQSGILSRLKGKDAPDPVHIVDPQLSPAPTMKASTSSSQIAAADTKLTVRPGAQSQRFPTLPVIRGPNSTARGEVAPAPPLSDSSATSGQLATVSGTARSGSHLPPLRTRASMTSTVALQGGGSLGNTLRPVKEDGPSTSTAQLQPGAVGMAGLKGSA